MLNELSAEIHKNNTKFYTDLNTGDRVERNVPEMLMLIVSKIAEAMEGHRKNLMDTHLPQYKMFDVELADAFIRQCDLCGYMNVDIDRMIAEKRA